MKKKTKNIIFSVLGGLALVGTGLGLGFGLTSGYSHDDTTYVEVEEIWLADDYKFDGTNLSALCSYITGVEGSTSEDLSGEYTSEDIRTVNDGLDIVVTLGGLKWSVVFVQGSVITLWLTSSEQDYFTEYYNEHGNYFDYATFYQSGTGTGLYSPWTSGWTSSVTDEGTVDFYPANSYGTSYIRTVVLNNSSLDGERFNYYATGNDNVVEHYQDWDHIFAPFTMFDYNAPQKLQDEGIFGLKSFLVPLCEYSYVMGQVSNYDYQLPNESTDGNSGFSPNPSFVSENYYNERFNYSEHHNYETNIGYYQWLEDTLWLPSYTEVRAGGLWATSTGQRANVNGSSSVSSGIYGHTWLRSGAYNSANKALRITAAGAATATTGGNVNYKYGVRPALHLNLDKASKYTTGLNWINQADTSWKGLGTESSPYLISSAEELAGIAYEVNINKHLYRDVYFKQTANINLAGYDWTPIGTSAYPFAGKYDGGGFKIDNLYINSEENYQGFIGYATYGSDINNVHLNNVYITGADYVGGIGGWTDLMRLQDCSVSGVIKGNNYVGGMIGHNDCALFINCHNKASVSGVNNVGGLIGWDSFQTAKINNCSNKGAISGTNYVGGLVGKAETADIQESFNDGKVSGTQYVGGLIGQNKNTGDGALVANCYNLGLIQTTGTSTLQNIGGIAGQASGEINNSYNKGTIITSATTGNVGGIVGSSSAYIDACYNTGAIVGATTSFHVAGIVGQLDSSTNINNCYNAGSIINGDIVAGIAGWCSGTNLISNCHNKGEISAKSCVGGIVGSSTGSVSLELCSNSVNLTATTGDYVGGLYGIAYSGDINANKCVVEGTILGNSYVGGLIGGLSDDSLSSGIASLYAIDCSVYAQINATYEYSAGLFVGAYDNDKSATTYTFNLARCTYQGSSNVNNLPMYSVGSTVTITKVVDACYVDLGLNKYYTSGDFSGYTIVNNMNNGLPIQNNLYAVAIGGNTSEEVIADLQSKGFELLN